MNKKTTPIDTVRASRAGHTFHERWAARRALQLVFPGDDLCAIAVESLSTSETAEPGKEAEDIADLTLFFGHGDNFASCELQKTLQFKYKTTPGAVTSSYLKKTIQKFAKSLLGYEKEFSPNEVRKKLRFSFVTNAEFEPHLWDAIKCLQEGTQPAEASALEQYRYLEKWCQDEKVQAEDLFSLTEFQASTKNLTAQNMELHRTLSSWSPGADSQARARLHGLEELIREKAGVLGQRNNLVKREDVLDALGCDSEDDLFPAETEFVDVGHVVERKSLGAARQRIEKANKPFFIFADGGVGKTVFIQSLVNQMAGDYEAVIFDCFGGGSYRSEDQSRHLPKVGLLQIVNELASRGLCDPQLPSDGDSDALVRAARRRLERAAATIREQSTKKGILVVIDASDNAQLEADARREKAFPRLLLASLSRDPVDDVKLVLTARSHRMDSVIGTSDVERFQLGTFTEDETLAFLESRRNDLSKLEFSTAFARSGGNARVLEYLVESWHENISHAAPREKITVEELIGQRCEKVHRELHQAGWNDDEIVQFFTAISLLPPPIPLNEMADALDWSEPKVNSVVSDLAPMLEVVKHGAIFRDEPTETFIRESYTSEKKAQQEIADRLNACQTSSVYAAEALPRFLVIIDDSDRAYALSASKDFPASIQSEYGRHRLKLLRLQAAFSLAAKERDYDRVLRLAMQLALVASANAKGDRFIRRSPGVAIALGDQDTSRRLYQDRSGWRGERDVRLTVALAFQGEMEEAEIHQNRAIGWINWSYRNRREEDRFDRSGPSASDFAAVMFLSFVQGAHALADSNITKWNFAFALSVCEQTIVLLEQYEFLTGKRVLADLVKFASGKSCKSLALQISLLTSTRDLDFFSLRSVARAASTVANAAGDGLFDDRYDYQRSQQASVINASVAALLHNSRRSAINIYRTTKPVRMSSYDFGERHGPFRGWTPILSACVSAWSGGQTLQPHHLTPHDVATTSKLRAIADRSELIDYLDTLETIGGKSRGKTRKDQEAKKQFNRRECEDIAKGIELVIDLAEPLQDLVLRNRKVEGEDFHKFLEIWEDRLQVNLHWRSETAQNNLCRNVGLGFSLIFLRHSTTIFDVDAEKFIDLLSQGCFTISDKLEALSLLARHPNLHILSGAFAKKVSDDIRQDEYVELRSEQFSGLADALLPMSAAEAQEYFRQGLSQLDQMGGDDHDIIYSLLHYAVKQRGGWLAPALGHRLMNLCQTIFHDEPSKFGWTLFGSAAAQSIGTQAVYKLVRWADQDAANLSYGLPQLACFLAEKGHLDPRRAAFMLLLCEEEGWHDWKVGDGLSDLLGVSNDKDGKSIWRAIFENLKFEHPFGGSEYLWVSLCASLDSFPGATDDADIECLRELSEQARVLAEEERSKDTSYYSGHRSFSGKEETENDKRKIEEAFGRIVQSCKMEAPHSIDDAIRKVREDRRFAFNSGKRIIERLREECPYDQRAQFMFMLGELLELNFSDSIEILVETGELWETSSAHIASNKKSYVEKLFELRGSELFDLRYSGMSREIYRLIEFCDDTEFVLNLVLNTVAREKIELTGDEWLQLATNLCELASGEANLSALEDVLSGAAGQFGDEIGEGRFRDTFTPPSDQSHIVADLTWHLLGNEDVFIRWTAARSIKGLADLGLHSEIATILDYYDRIQTDALVTEGKSASFLNAQQWLLMGLARACLYHGNSLSFLRQPLEQLIQRDDIHTVNKVHIIRCLQNISGSKTVPTDISKLWDWIYTPPKGYRERDGWPKATQSRADFGFDYEFSKHEIAYLARLFGIAEADAANAVAAEVRKRWPKATDMSDFYGTVRYRRSELDHYESYRESVQRHGMLAAATTLAKTKPVIRESYEATDANPWMEWLKTYDVSFEDGAWLSDRKDAVPKQAQQQLTTRLKNEDVLESEQTILQKIGLLSDNAGQPIPLYGQWRSGDGVSVRISSALALRKGAIGRCKNLSGKSSHDVWLPTFGSDGEVDPDIQKSDFEPLIWLPERYPIGIDAGDKFATRYPVARARLGKALASTLGLEPIDGCRSWIAKDKSLAVRSQVWGEWRPDPDNHGGRYQDEGMVLWAQPDWLAIALSSLDRGLVFHVDFYKHRSYRDYDDTPGLRAVYVALQMLDGTLRIWKAKEASKAIY